tara:strand:+ start:141 stop:434 length:294 start_codon:yes stop_codon:yes gene_type:complete
MAITKSTEADKIEVVGPYKAVQVRVSDVFTEDGTEISRGNYHRHVIQCQEQDADGNWHDTDVSGEYQEVQDICNSGIWTEAIKEAYREAMDQPPEGP